MAKKQRVSPPRAPEPERSAVTLDRFTRLYRMLQLLGEGPQTRASLIRRLRLDVRGFYRDLELLRSAGILVSLVEGRYALDEAAERVMERLPFPDPHLTLGEVRRLARGRTEVHRHLQERIAGALA